MKQKPPEEWTHEFHATEHRFAPQGADSRAAGALSGLYMLYAYDLWDRFTDGYYWWMHLILMVGVWVLFAALLFVIEPLIIRRTFQKHTRAPCQATLIRMLWMHRVMLALSLLAIFAAVGGSHGLF